MRTEQIQILFRYDTILEMAIKGLQTVLMHHNISMSDFKLYGQALSLDQLSAKLKKMNHEGFDIVGQGFNFTCGSVKHNNLDVLTIQTNSNSTILWDDWVAQFIFSNDFIMAWITDYEYNYWQNAKDVLQYTAVGKDYAHLPMKSNDLPYPLEQKIIDTSANPGRQVFQNGYIEAIGSVMWLSDSFWQLTRTNKSQVEKASWLKISNPLPTVLRIQTAPNCFITDEGTIGEIQQNLRSLLFFQCLIN